MQLDGVGSGGHSANMHHVSECMHEHSHYKPVGGAARAGGANGAVQPQQTPQEGQLSLSAWMEKMLGKGKGLLKGIWGSNDTAASGEAGDKSGASQTLAQIREDAGAEGISANVSGQNNQQPDLSGSAVSQVPHTPQVAAAATAVVPPQTMQENPYFSAVQNAGGEQDNLWQKIKVKFKDVAGQLTGHLPRKFSGFFQTKNSFQPKQEPPKQDLRKHSKFRRDEVEIDCVLTDDSYLLDSYDRKGEYSKLSAKK